MTEYKVNLEQLQMLEFLEQHTDTSIQTLSQGEINGKWYFGKELRINNRQVDSVLIEDGTFLINEKMQHPQTKAFEDKRIEAKDNISSYGFRVGKPLLTPDNYFSKQGILEYVNVVNVVSAVSEGMDKYYIEALEKTTFNTYTTLSTQTTQTTQQAKLSNITSLRDLLKYVQDTYMDLHQPKLTTLTTHYILSTYIYELFTSMGYLFLSSDSGTGKTKWATIISLMSFNSINATNTTESAMFRIVEQAKGLLFIDDYDRIEEKKKAPIDQLLKVGYKRNGKTCRTEKIGDNYVPTFFDVYCPKLITNTEGLDPITYSRCIPLHLIKTLTDKGRLDVKDSDLFWQQIRDLCYVWAFKNWRQVKEVYDTLKIDNLNNRDLELVKPILAVAKVYSEEDYNTCLEIVKDIFDNRDMFDFTTDWDYVLFNSLQKYYSNWDKLKQDTLQTKDVLDLMLQDMRFEEDDDKRPGVKWVGRLLSRIDMFPKKRESAGVMYTFSLESIEKYMKTRGWL
jgi:hypothetical protein